MPRAVNGMKTCTKCGERKPIDMYSAHTMTVDKKRPACKACHVLSTQDYKTRNPEWQLGYMLKRQYNMTLTDYKGRLASQDFSCPICRRRFLSDKKLGTYACVDHDHGCCPGQYSCGECVRGVICFNCNTVLGKVRDDPSTLRRAIKYLEGGGL